MLRTGSPFTFTRPEPTIYWVQSKQATLNEAVVAQALDKYNIEYVFQANYLGGRQMRGGYVADFLITNPFQQVLEVFGDYWHMGQMGAGDRMKLIELANFLGQKVAIVWGHESKTVPDAVRALRREGVIR